MPSRALFKDKQLRLCVVTTLAAGSVGNTTEALLLPPKPLAFSSTWDCRSDSDNEWLCRTSAERGYNESLESAARNSRKRQTEPAYSYHSAVAREPVYGPPDLPPPVSEQYRVNPAVAESAVLLELLNASPENYVLQWLAANNREPLERLKAQYPVLQDATIAQYQRAGRQWFILLDGPYPSRIAAMAALKRDARAAIADKFYPWTRSIASIQQLDLIRPEQIADSGNPYLERSPVQQHMPPSHKGLVDTGDFNLPHSVSAQGYQPEPRYNNTGGYTPYPETPPPATRNNQGYSNNPHQQIPRRAITPPVSAASPQQPVYEHPDRYQHPENALVNQQRINRPVTPGIPDRYGYPENYITGDPYAQQRPSQLAEPFQDAYGANNLHSNQQPYHSAQSPDMAYSQQHQPQVQQPYSHYSEPQPYNNDLRYATASTGQQIILPPRRERPNYSSQKSHLSGYRSEQNQPDYNVLQPEYSDYGYNPEFYRETPEPAPQDNRRDYGASAVRPEEFSPGYNQPYIDTAFNAPPGSYTIQWLAAKDKSSLERIQLRYPVLQNTRIIHYRKRNSDWYVLVGGTFISREAAQTALSLPPYSRLTARLYPWVRTVEGLQKMVASSTLSKPSRQDSSHSTPLQKIISNADNSYTIQWYAANKPEAVRKMKQRFPELANAVTVHFRRNHKDWYVLLQGQYSSSKDAISAIKSPAMRDAARLLHPWTRPVNTLKNLNIQEQS